MQKSAEDLAEIKRRMDSLPTAWQFITSQFAYLIVVAGIVLGMWKVMFSDH